VSLFGAPLDRAQVEEYAVRIHERVCHCGTHDDLCDGARDPSSTVLVIDMYEWSRQATTNLALAACHRHTKPRICALFDRSPRDCELMADTIFAIPTVESIYRQYAALPSVLPAYVHEWAPSGTTAIVLALGRGLLPYERRILTACVAESERSTTKARVAVAAGVSTKSVDALVGKLGFTGWPEMRSMLRIWHGVHRMESSDVSPQVAGVLAGLEGGAHSFDNLSRDHTRRSPLQLRRSGLAALIEGRQTRRQADAVSF
jgi:hypothetical protein